MTTRIIASMDTGVDDALALAYLMKHDAASAPQRDADARNDCELLGVLATYGNVDAATAARNTRYVLDMFGRNDIPVLQGSSHPSWAHAFIPDAGCAQFHGPDGLGGFGPHTPPVTGLAIDIQQLYAATERATADITNPAGPVDNIPVVSVGGYPLGDPHANPATQIRPNDAAESSSADSGQAATDAHRHRSAPVTDQTISAAASDGIAFLIEQVRRFGRELTVLATGPLTDIDAAIRRAPDIASKLRLVMMGGSLTQPGNCWDGVAETNIIQDPEAADRVFHSGADITMIGLDVTHQCLLGSTATAQWRRHAASLHALQTNNRTSQPHVSAHAAVADADDATAQSQQLVFLANIADFSITANLRSDPTLFAAGMPLHDPLAAAVALDPTLVSTFDLPLRAEIHTGDFTGVRGRTIGDPALLNDPTVPRVHVALEVDAERFVKQFTDGFTMKGQLMR